MRSNSADLIDLAGITRVYAAGGLQTHALSAVDLRVAAGEFVAVMGPSGSGKSTLLAVVGLLERPDAGQYCLDGRNVTELSRGAYARLRNEYLGFVFQDFNLITELTVWQNVELPLIYRDLPAAERKRQVGATLERLGLSHWAGHRPQDLSGGQQQRVAVARAVVGQPALLLADEPTGNLDSESGEMVMDLLQELHAAGSTILMVTHDPLRAQRARRLIRLLDGRIVQDAAIGRAVGAADWGQ